jgi:hypothetical protein
MKVWNAILTVLALFGIILILDLAALAQQQRIDTRQRPTNPPQSAVGVPQLPSQRALPLDRWGRAVVPGRRGVVAPGYEQGLQPGFQPYGLSSPYARRLLPGQYRVYRDEYGRAVYGRIP